MIQKVGDLQSLFLKCNFEKRDLPTRAIEAIETATGFELPADYKFYLESYAGFEGFLTSEYLVLWDADQLLQCNNGYDIMTHLPCTIAIGSNGGGEFIGIELEASGNFRLIISSLIDLDSSCHHKIGDSFSGMLERLHHGGQYFQD